MSARPVQSPERILVIKLRYVGDVVLSTPVLSRLRAAWPKARITMLVNRGTEGVLQGHPDVDEKGTEAAAVTALAFEVVITSAGPPPIKFFVDRPFLFAVRDEKTGTLLFVGLIASP